MTFFNRALRFLVAATFVFVNLVCPCATAYAAGPVENAPQHGTSMASNCHEQAAPVQESPAVSALESTQEAGHEDCADCSAALALGCDEQVLVVPASNPLSAPPADSGADPSIAVLLALASLLPPPALSLAVAVLPDNRWAQPVDSPVRRHDRTLV